MRKQNKKLFDDKHQLQKMFLNVDNLILKHNIKLDNKHELKLVFRWNESFRIQRTDSMKSNYILKEINETRFKRTYTDNRLKRFKIENVKNSLTKQIKIYEILNITYENSIDAMKKSNIINKDVRIDDELRNEVVRNIAESSDADRQIFENNVTNNNLSNSKTQNIHARIKSNIRCSNQLIAIENPLNSVGRSTNIITFATIDEILIEKE